MRIWSAAPSLSLLFAASTAGALGAAPTDRILGPLYGAGAPGCGSATTAAQEAACQLDGLAASKIPITAYLFEGAAWSSGGCSFALGTGLVDRLRSAGTRAIVDTTGGCTTTAQYDALEAALGDVLLGVYAGQDYAAAAQAIGWAAGTHDVVVDGWTGTDGGVDGGQLDAFSTSSVGDLPADFEGMREGIRRIFAMGKVLPLPYAPLSSTDPSARPDEETLVRRLHWGAMQPVMAMTPRVNTDPWRTEYGGAAAAAASYYALLHWELVPYLYSYAFDMHERGWFAPLFRNPDPGRFTTRLGEDIFVAYVTDRTTSIDVTFPGCKWFDYWDESQAYETATTVTFSVPLGREPIFLRRGAIIPMRVVGPETGHGTMESAGSLTVLAYPSATTSMKYRQASTGTWVQITSTLADTALTLETSEVLDRPVIWRIGRWDAAPSAVGVTPLGITVNRGGSLPLLATEAAVNGSRVSAYFYDAAAKRIVVKFVAGADAGPDDAGMADAGVEGDTMADEGEASSSLEAGVPAPLDGAVANIADTSVDDASVAADGSAAASETPEADGGCGCTIARSQERVCPWALALLGLALRRRRT